MENKVCNVCGVEQPLTNFSPSPTTIDGRIARCKKCVSALYKIQNDKIKSGKYSPLEMAQRDEDIEGAKEVLTALGYDFNNEKSIHEQFMERIATKYGGL